MKSWLIGLLRRSKGDVFGNLDYWEELHDGESTGEFLVRTRCGGILRLTEQNWWKPVDRLPRRRRKLSQDEVQRLLAVRRAVIDPSINEVSTCITPFPEDWDWANVDNLQKKEGQ